jgi:MHS family proline/betaine transporter-like MFS transporter
MSQTQVADPPKASDRSATMVRATIAGTIGNVLEWYDFAVYGYLVTAIGAAFFPKASTLAQVLYTFGIYGVGFFMRPVGSIIIGAYGDRVGRRAALTLTVGLMGVATMLIGFLPTYATLGVWAPLLLILMRLVQGFSGGGEWGGAATFLVEFAPTGKRGFIGSWQQFSVGAGFLLGSGFVYLLTATLGADAMAAWGWRIPFLCGIFVAGFAVYFRLKLPDTPEFLALEQEHTVSKHPLRELFVEHRSDLITQFGITIHNTACYYITLQYMQSWLTTVVKMAPNQAMLINTIGLVGLAIATPFIGALSDRIGRKPLLITSCIGFIVLCYPGYWLASTGQFWVVLVVQVVLVLLVCTYSACVPATYAELFPTRIRYSGMSIGYNLAVMLFGGFAPFIATWLVATTGNIMSPTFYVIACAIITLIFVLRMRETAFSPLKH